jgi:hypothetical protein
MFHLKSVDGVMKDFFDIASLSEVMPFDGSQVPPPKVVA